MSIQAIDKTSVHKITSAQVIIDLPTAVKELLENALDAGATSVEIRFKEHGLEAIEVLDNGKGIEESDWAGIALKHHTSKLVSFADLAEVSTLGFRGEALSSLCGTAVLSIVTATAATSPAATSLSFSSAGVCSVGGKAARSKGTTVTVRELFKAYPVRRKELEKNAKREFAKAVELVQSYALIRTDCRIDVKNSVKGKSTTHLQTSASSTIRSNFSSVFGTKALAPMMDLDLDLDVVADKSALKYAEVGSTGSTRVLVKGLISKPTTGSGRTSGNRQFYFINGRPFLPSKIAKVFNEVYKSFNTGSFPCVVADFQLPPDSYDVNVSPDKRTIFLHSEGNLIAALKSALEELFQPSRSTFPMSQIGPPKATSSDPARKRSRPSSPTPDTPTEEEDELGSLPAKRKRGLSIASDDIDMSELEDDDDGATTAGLNVAPRVDDDGAPEVVERACSEALPDQDGDTRPGAELALSAPATPPTSNPVSDDQASTLERLPAHSPSPSRSPSPALPKLRQITLDTTVASWARTSVPRPLAAVASGGAAGATGRRGLKAVVKHLQQFVNPSQRSESNVEVEITDQLESADEGEDEGEDELEAEASVDDMLVIEDSFVITANARNGRSRQLSPSLSRRRTRDDGAFGLSDDEPDDEEVVIVDADLDASLEQERQEHLASLDAAGTTANTSSLAEEVIGTQVAADITLSFDFPSVAAEWTSSSYELSTKQPAMKKVEPLAGASVEEEIESAEATLSRVVSKEDFATMQVIGQFNLGFIIARRTVSSGDQSDVVQDDLFIVDQHASDEKYNFERLQADTTIQSQRLLQPRSLDLPSQNELTAMENLDMLKLNGFEVLVDDDASVGQRVKLIAQPVSKDTVFGAEDLEELLDLIGSSSAGQVVRPSKARKMFASRACRKSVMIGKALSLNQMTTVVRHMGAMDQPWACPHGRPTMRWLAGLGATTADQRSNLKVVLQSYASPAP